MSNTPPPLVALRIPEGWLVSHNNLREIDPERMPTDDPNWGWLSQDLAQFVKAKPGLLVDVGWYARDGEFGVKVILDHEWDRPLGSVLSTRSLGELIGMLERILQSPPDIPVERLVERLEHPSTDARAHAASELARIEAIEAIDAIMDAAGRELHAPTRRAMGAAMDALIQERNRRA